MALNLDKDLKLYYSISEVAAHFGVSETLLRFWEKQFPQQIKPRKSGRNMRQYTKEDIQQIAIIYNLVKVRGLKLAAARLALARNRQGVEQTAEAVNRLRAVRAELMAIKHQLDTLQ